MAKKFPQPGGNMKNMMKQMEKLQRDMAATQQEVESKIFEETAGGGMVKVVMNGKKEIVELIIAPEVVDPEDIDTLQDLVAAAVNACIRKAETEMDQAMGVFTQGLNLPGIF